METTSNKEKLTYCVFIDVLGYGELVKNVHISVDARVNILNSIYSNLASTLLITINEINKVIIDKIYIKSFSDCFFLESTNIRALLYTCNRIFNDTFGFYSNFQENEEYTPLLRGGIVKDWMVLFNDLSSMVNNQEGTNPVGLAVARAYWTSEKSKISGMRIIISEEVIGDLDLRPYSRNGFECLIQEYTYYNIPQYLFFDKIEQNEEGHQTSLYELIWPEQVMSTCTFEYVDQLHKIRDHFDEKSVRHYKKTAEVILKGLLLTDCNCSAKEPYEKALTFLMHESE